MADVRHLSEVHALCAGWGKRQRPFREAVSQIS